MPKRNEGQKMNWKSWIKAFLLSKLVIWFVISLAALLFLEYHFKNTAIERVAEDLAETAIENELKLPQGTIKQEMDVLDKNAESKS